MFQTLWTKLKQLFTTNAAQNVPAFNAVLAAELTQIDDRRRSRALAHPAAPAVAGGVPVPPLKNLLPKARERRLVGLAFSGGGIRSATFNLGVLQALAGLGLLKYVDYLSTVSGGGYIGAWLAAWIKEKGAVEVERQLQPTAAAATCPPKEPAPIMHLRRHTNYLAPQQGFLSADRWVLWATYLRNFLLNQLVLLPTVMAVLLVSRLVMFFYYPVAPYGYLYDTNGKRAGLATPCLLAVLGLVALFGILALVNALRAADLVRGKGDAAGPTGAKGPAWLAWGVVAPLSVAALIFCYLAPYQLPIATWLGGLSTDTWLVRIVEAGCFMLGAVVLSTVCYLVVFCRSHSALRSIGWCALGGLVGGLVLYGVYFLLFSLFNWDGTDPLIYVQISATASLTTFGPPLFLLAVAAGIFLGVGATKSQLGEELREWWSSVCARLLLVATIWVTVNLVALYGTALVLWAGPWVRTALASGWLVTVAGGVLAGGSAKTEATRPKFSLLEPFARFAFHIFVAGLVILLSLLVHALVDKPPNWEQAGDGVWPRTVEPERPAIEITSDRRVTPKGTTDELRRRVDYRKVVNEPMAIRQRYWMGLLNTDAYANSETTFSLVSSDFESLKDQGVPSDILKKLEPLRDAEPSSSREEFEEQLDRLLNDPATEPLKTKILKRAGGPGPSIALESGKLWGKLLGWLLGCLAVLALAAWRVDVNLFSLHALYGNRLRRAYLGASRVRAPDPVTSLDPDDDVDLATLRHNAPTSYTGPYLLVNTAMNLVHTTELAWQERKAESFVMSPCYCGSETTGYRDTAAAGAVPAYADGVSVGTATTISGAAASPNMGYHSSPAVTILLTVFNARLGAWLGNPANENTWKSAGPTFGFAQLFAELFGLTGSAGRYVYLSDGGHFENLGVYELVRRRCQYIIVADAGQDGDYSFEDLGNLIRKVRIDFGIRIEIDPGLLRPQGDSLRSRWHCAIGRIRYDDTDPGAQPGTLVYLKPSLTGDEPVDVLQYAAGHLTFPHESTGNQFYTESQFESYRALGQHVAEAVFTQPVVDMEDEVADSANMSARCRSLFSSVERRWFALPPKYEAAFIESTDSYVAVQKACREDARLWRLTLDVYPELAPTKEVLQLVWSETREEQARRRSAELHVIAQMLQTMENAWLSLNLEVNYAHPMNRGWMDVFHRWTSAETVRLHWPLLRAEFGRDFVSFCEKQMRLGVVHGRPLRVQANEPPWRLARLLTEFEDQWPGAQTTRLRNNLERSQQGDEGRFAWLICSDNPYPPLQTLAVLQNEVLPAGLILVAPDDKAEFQAIGPKEYILFVWLRGAYRNTGLGRPAVHEVLHGLPALLPRPFWLNVRLPTAELTGPGGQLQKAMWLTFFHHHEFVRVTAGAAATDTDTLLRRIFP